MSFQALEDSIYAAMTSQLPTVKFIFAYNDAPEVPMPYVVIDIMRTDAIGNPTVEHLETNGKIMMLQPFEAKVQFETCGDQRSSNSTGAIAIELDLALRNPLMGEQLALNNLSLMRTKAIDRFPRTRDTKTFMVFQQEVFFGYTLKTDYTVDHIATLGLDGEFTDAGRAGNVIQVTSLTDSTIPIA